MKERVDVADLAIGMYVSELDRPWLDTPFLFQGFPIRTAEELAQVRACCDYVYVDIEQSERWAPPEKPREHRFETRRINVQKPAARPAPNREQSLPRPFQVEYPEAVQVYERAHSYIRNLLDDIRLGHSVDAAGARQLADEMADSIVRNENTLVWLTQLKHRDEYTSRHSLNVCILALLFGRHLELTRQQMGELGLGALLHDIGKMRVPLEILNKPEHLTSAEVEILKTHPLHGYDILKDEEGISPDALDIVRSHHERVDGSGYPRGLKGDHIARFAKIVSVVDVYDAITSDRVYHMGISPHEALNLMYGWAPNSFEKALLEEFIRCLGIYPVGSIVELQSGEVGVVMTVNRRRHLQPLITLLLDADKQPYRERKLLDLELQAKAGEPVNVRRILKSGAHGIDVRQVILQDPAVHAMLPDGPAQRDRSR